MGRLEQRVVLVTGATSGIGHAIALRCAAEGARVLATGRDEARLAELERSAAAPGSAGPAGAVSAAGATGTAGPAGAVGSAGAVAGTGPGGSIIGHAADLGQVTAADECVAAVLSAFGRLDGVVHAAGIIRRQEDLRDTTDEQWARMMNVNLDASFRLARACLRAMVPHGGSIVLIGSQLAQVAAPGYASYCASKGAVESLVRALAVDFGPSGVRVNALAPGVVATPLAYVDRPDFDGQVAAIAARLPLRRIGQPDDMAGPAVFLLSDDSAWMTGQSLVVDGGYLAQ
jgi:NAD(P)-dependent dehydrogenase (short-subunit alcohol dehydrogenase family)